MMERNAFISGAIFMAACTAGTFFLNFWRLSRDRFFLIFSFSFWLLAVERVIVVAFAIRTEETSAIFLIRLTAFICIILAILDKNKAAHDR